MAVPVVIVCASFGMLMVGLSVWANARFQNEEALPLQSLISRSQPLAQTIIRSGPRAFVLSFVPGIAICTLVLVAIGASMLTPRPRQEGMPLSSMHFICGIFVAVYVLHLWLIEQSLRQNRGYTNML